MIPTATLQTHNNHFPDVGKMVVIDCTKATIRKYRIVRPESLPPDEDVKKVERRLASEEKKSLKNPDGLKSEG